AYVYPYAFHYRVGFHERVRELLAAHGVTYNVVYSSEPHFDDPRGDFAAPPWAIDTRTSFRKLGSFALRYQHAFHIARKHDLVVVQQENGLLLNYALQLLA